MSHSDMQEENLDKQIDLEERSKRVSILRASTRLSRKAFCQKTGLSERTLQFWENGEGKGITEDGAKNLLAGCEKIGLFASFDWLMNGIGEPPFMQGSQHKLYIQKSKPNPQKENQNIESAIKEELTCFEKNCANPDHIILEDDSMAPSFRKDDLVAGDKYFEEGIEKAIGQDCIVLLKNGLKLFRKVKSGQKQGSYNLLALNLNSDATYLIIQDAELISAAPIAWMRRKITND